MRDESARKTFASIAVGEKIPVLTWTANERDMQAFTELTPARPDNPTRAGNPHLDAEYAKTQIYGALWVDGNHTVALLCQAATNWLPRGSLVSGDSEVDMRFPNPVRVGDVVTFTGEVTGKRSEGGRDYVVLKMQADNDKGKTIAFGTVTAYVPKCFSNV
jgi:acyl dehydratase